MPRRHHHRPAKRLLILPAAVLLLLFVGLHQLDALHPRPLDPGMAVDGAELAPPPGDAVVCDRADRVSVERARPPVLRGGRVTSTLVVACPAAYDGMRVRYVGEVVGDVLHRDGGAWVLVNDDDYALEVGPLPAHRELRGANSGLTVWLPGDLADAIGGVGRPDRRGDVVEVEGVVVRADPSDGGGLTLRATTLTVLEEARDVHEPLDRPQLWFAVGASLVAALLWGARRRGPAR